MRTFSLAIGVALENLRQYPAAGYYSMRLEKLFIGRGTHLRRYHTLEIIFYWQFVDESELAVFNDYARIAGECLGFLAFPMEINAYGNIADFEIAADEIRFEYKGGIFSVVPYNLTAVADTECLLSGNKEACFLTPVGGVE